MPILTLLPIVTALVVTVLRFTELGTKRDLITGKVEEKTTLRLFIANGLLVLLVALAEYLLHEKTLAPLPYSIGVACAVASFLLRRRAITALGRYWSLHVETRDTHELVTAGPFRWMRHPVYLSMILELLAFSFILSSFYAPLVGVICFTPVLVFRIRIEEKTLIEKFGDSYRDYIRTTPALFPWRVPKR